MSVTLITTANDDAQPPQRFVVRAGEIAVVGRSPWADISLTHADLAEQHFRINCRDLQCTIESISGDLARNGEAITAAPLDDGDTLEAAGLQFTIQLGGLVQKPTVPAGTIAGDTPRSETWFAELLERAALSPNAAAFVVDEDPLTTLDQLLQASLNKDACHTAIAALEPADAMEWAIHHIGHATSITVPDQTRIIACLRDQTTNDSTTEDSTTRDGTTAPDTRGPLTVNEVDDHIRSLSTSVPEAWLWKAVRWSAFSLSAEGNPVVTPSPHLFTVALNVAVTLAATNEPADAWSRWITDARDRIERKYAVDDTAAEAPIAPASAA